VFLTVQLDVQKNVLAVPTTAMLTGQDSSYVYVVDAQNVAKPRNVAPGMEVAGMTIVYRGLHDGEEVVVDGQSRLNPGSKVTIIRPGADTARGGKLGGTEAP
jgi:multidrug efflux system membrane fusion protein